MNVLQHGSYLFFTGIAITSYRLLNFALAAAVCHHLQTKALLNATGKATEKFKDWKSFVDNNKDKVKKS